MRTFFPRLLAIVAFVGFSAGAAVAQDPPATPHLTVGQCVQALSGLLALDKYEKVIKDGAGEKTVTVQYKLGVARFAVARAISVLRPVAEDVEKARLGLLAEVTGGKPVQPNSEQLARLNDEYAKVLSRPCSVEIPKLKLADLRPGDGPNDNPIPPSVLASLLPIIEE